MLSALASRSKFAKGANAPQVLRKLYLLVCYLKATCVPFSRSVFSPSRWCAHASASRLRRHQLGPLERFPRALPIVQYHVQYLHGGAIGARPTSNVLGHEVWNEVRRSCFKAPRSPGIRRAPRDGATPAASASTEEEHTRSEWGALGPGAVIWLDSLQARRARGDDEGLVRVTALEPDEVAMLGPRASPTYHTLTLPAYDE